MYQKQKLQADLACRKECRGFPSRAWLFVFSVNDVAADGQVVHCEPEVAKRGLRRDFAAPFCVVPHHRLRFGWWTAPLLRPRTGAGGSMQLTLYLTNSTSIPMNLSFINSHPPHACSQVSPATSVTPHALSLASHTDGQRGERSRSPSSASLSRTFPALPAVILRYT